MAPPNRRGNAHKGGARRAENNRIYANPLPIVFEDIYSPRFSSILSFLGINTRRCVNPHCEGIFDPTTRSVWITNARDTSILWQRGFFGKGDLSRSEPSWLSRQINLRKSKGKGLTSEEMTARRRAERKQFKLDRAKAIAQAAAEAEAAFVNEGRVVPLALSGPNIPSAATWKPTQPVVPDIMANLKNEDEEEEEEEGEEPLVDVEHLQLTLQEAFFLTWTLDCLTILDKDSLEPMSLQDIWTKSQHVFFPPLQTAPPPLRFDNPFLIHYAVYHHYRALGWVVKGGIKFCVDYLLYKRGPVFAHAEFAIVVCPVYEHEEDRVSCPFTLQNASPFTWSWLSTLNRVNSQVQKTLVLTYVTIPSYKRLSNDVLLSPAVFSHYSVREVIVRRFIPARMRD